MDRIYACIDLKSFYASVECHERGLNPITTNLVVADSERTEKTICLAVSPSLRSYGISSRARLFEVVSKVNEINNEKRKKNKLISKSANNEKVRLNPNIELDFIIAKPRMSLYIKYSTMIYNVYLKFLSKEDIYVYSIDEVFCDLTNYLKYSKKTKEELVTEMIKEIFRETGITATGGIGTNLYLAKVAMDILAKHIKPNEDNVRIAYLDEMSYRKLLWSHIPLSDFWRVGMGYMKKLNDHKMFTMGDIALQSIENEEVLYELFGVNAEILIDHAWGYEPCSIKDIKSYKPENNSLSRGQVLHEAYDYLKTKLIVMEMIDLLSLDLVEHHLVCNSLALTINYDASNLNNNYHGVIKKDYYGRNVFKEAHKTINLERFTSSPKILTKEILKLYEKIVDSNLLSRRITITALNVISEDEKKKITNYQQFDLFSNNVDKEKELKDEEIDLKVSKTLLNIKKKYGKNAIIKGMDLLDGATTIERNKEIGGHKA